MSRRSCWIRQTLAELAIGLGKSIPTSPISSAKRNQQIRNITIHLSISEILLISDPSFLQSDEILYHAAIHPETNTRALSTAQITRLYSSLHEVTSLVVRTHADPEEFPDTWLFRHRWGKGKKDSPNMLLNGAKISFITVGGRTTAVVASVQKKTEVSAGPEEASDEPKKSAEGDPDVEEETTKAKKSRVTKKSKVTKEPEQATTLVKPQKGKSRSVKQEDHATRSDVTNTEGKHETAEELPEPTITTPAKSSHRKNRAVKKEVEPSTTEFTDSKAETKSTPTSVASKKRKAKTDALLPEAGLTTTATTDAANPMSKKQKATPSRSANENPTEPTVSTEPATSPPPARKKTKAALAKDGTVNKSQTTSKGLIISNAVAAAGEGEGLETRRRSRRVSGRGPG